MTNRSEKSGQQTVICHFSLVIGHLSFCALSVSACDLIAWLCLKALRRLLAQLPRARLSRNVPLRLGQHLVTHHEFSDRSGAKQRRIEMRVEMMNRLDSRVARRLMPPHRVRKGNAKKVVVTRRG